MDKHSKILISVGVISILLSALIVYLFGGREPIFHTEPTWYSVFPVFILGLIFPAIVLIYSFIVVLVSLFRKEFNKIIVSVVVLGSTFLWLVFGTGPLFIK